MIRAQPTLSLNVWTRRAARRARDADYAAVDVRANTKEQRALKSKSKNALIIAPSPGAHATIGIGGPAAASSPVRTPHVCVSACASIVYRPRTITPVRKHIDWRRMRARAQR